MELSIEELEKLKAAILGNMATGVECISDNFAKYSDGVELHDLYMSILLELKELSDNAALLQKISNTIELTQISKSVENEEQ